MSIETLYDGLDATSLRQLLLNKSSTLSAETDESKRTNIVNEIQSIKKHLQTAVAEENRIKSELSVSLNESKTVNTERQHQHREITNSLSTVPTFGPGIDVHVHLNRLTNLYDLYVSGRDDEHKLEEANKDTNDVAKTDSNSEVFAKENIKYDFVKF